MNEGRKGFQRISDLLTPTENHLNENYCLRSSQVRSISSLREDVQNHSSIMQEQLINDIALYTVVQTQRRQKQISLLQHFLFKFKAEENTKELNFKMCL